MWVASIQFNHLGIIIFEENGRIIINIQQALKKKASTMWWFEEKKDDQRDVFFIHFFSPWHNGQWYLWYY